MSSEGWIHNFMITETSVYNKSYTIYKITSIVFPRHIPEALSTISVWKRYSEVKKLYKDVQIRKKQFHLKGNLPQIKSQSFFKRFDLIVIEERKQFILDLLYFIGQHAILFKSELFTNFFNEGHTPTISPKHNNSEKILEPINVNSNHTDSNLIPTSGVDVDNVDGGENDLTNSIISTTDSFLDAEVSLEDSSRLNAVESLSIDEITIDEISIDSSDYIYEAALHFSNALQAEVGGKYRESFEKYKCGIDCLLTGAKNDSNNDRRRVAKEKTEKYLVRAEDIYHKFLGDEYIENSVEMVESQGATAATNGLYLERPINQLSKFKVMRIIDRVMQVQDITNKKIYVMKVIERFPLNQRISISLVNDIPYMIPVVCYFQSDNSVYVLLRQASGGKLWDYIKSQSCKLKMTASTDIKTLFVDEIPLLAPGEEVNLFRPTVMTVNCVPENHVNGAQAIEEISKKTTVNRNLNNFEEEMKKNYIPSFDILSKDMDVNDLVNCSQKLLESVSVTLERTKASEVDVDEIKCWGTESFTNVQQNDWTCRRNHADNNFEVQENHRLSDILDVSLPEGTIRQWASQLIVSVDELHKNNIICGDLRMDNLLLGSNGQLQLSLFYRRSDKMIEFDLNVDEEYSMYVAPERPLTERSDFWSIGVILFELFTLKTINSCHPGGVTSYFSIQFPETELTKDVRDLIEGLLQVDPAHRYNEIDIKKHNFFKNIDWNEVLRNGRAEM